MDQSASAAGIPDILAHRMAIALQTAGIGEGTVVLNAFGASYGQLEAMAEQGLAQLGARSVSGEDLLHDQNLIATAFVGSPDRLFALCRAGYGDVLTHALVGGGAVFPIVHTVAHQHGITLSDMMVDVTFGPYALRAERDEAYTLLDGVEAQIMRPGSATEQPIGMVGEVVLRDGAIDIRTGVLSAFEQVPHRYRAPGLQGWMGFAQPMRTVDDAKVRASDLAAIVDEHPDVLDARLITFVKDAAQPVLQLETEAGAWLERDVLESFEAKTGLRPSVERVVPGKLANTGRAFGLRAA